MLTNEAGRPVRRWWGGVLFVAVLLIALHLPAQTPPPVPAGSISDPTPAGTISWWPGDGNANDIYSTNNGTLQAGAIASIAGVDSNAFWFDGTNNYVSIPDEPSLHPTNFTIESWMRCDLLDTPSAPGQSYPGQQYIIFHQNNNTGGFEGFDLAKDREPRFTGTNDTWCFELTSVSQVNTFVESQTIVKTNTWYHIAGVRGSNYIQLYVNGVLEAQLPIDFPVAYGPYPMYLATTGQSYWDHKFGGALDEIGFYDRVLSSNEIYAIYAAGRKGKTKTPTALAITMTNGVSPQVEIGGIPGQTYGIQTSSSLAVDSNAWVGLTNLTLSTSADYWTDPATATNGATYYRAIPGTISVP